MEFGAFNRGDLEDEPDTRKFVDVDTDGNVNFKAPMPVAVDRDSYIYYMKHRERGKAVILNNREFAARRLKTRAGTDEDREKLKGTLIALGFDVKVYDNPTKQKTLQVIRSLAAEDHTNRDCIVVAVFSHGERDLIHAYDDNFKPNCLWDPFDAHFCPTLAGKPKIFLIQACQGNESDSGTTLTANRTMVDASPSLTYRITNKADFVMAYSTCPGYYSWRDASQGSWFIQALCEVLNKHSETKDFLSMLTIVARYVTLNYETYVPGSKYGKKQVPFITSTLTRDIYFHPKLAVM